ncbi:putative LppA-like lipoprotein [Rhodococcus sp. SMB37]|uniref:LppA family lipoprotein n=1 Tax=Rhodococcus sp. SMB37 TaxID=2512213 RepID=UPI0006CFE753|nr:LppA family lipoprotein [Rhodococcus sp. SMB37]TCN56048.1 putative LppA-like lipoprotein [Rhodococcus sp. SMB37]
MSEFPVLRVCIVAAVVATMTGCATARSRAVPEPVADSTDAAVEYYLQVQRDVVDALSEEFPDLEFSEKYARTNAGCTLADGTYGMSVHLPIQGSSNPVPVADLQRAADLFERTAADAGFHGRQVLPPDTGFSMRMFAADGSYITFGSYVAAIVGLTVGCYRI